MARSIIKKITKCRACKNELKLAITLGPAPNANSYIKKSNIDKEEYYFPLDVYFCNKCSYLQLGHAIEPKVLFGDYLYVSSTSKVFVKHFKNYSKYIIDRFNLSGNSLVVDIGSNDGTLLLPFKKLGVRVLGIDPGVDIAAYAKKLGINTWVNYFNKDLAGKIVKEEGKATIVTANNTFAQISDSDELLKGLSVLLSDNGVFVVEVPYVVDMLNNGYFDLIYHEHHVFPSIKSLKVLFKRFNMEIFDVQKMPVHGGTVRVFVKKHKGAHRVERSVSTFLNFEKKNKVYEYSTYLMFAKKIQRSRIELLALLEKLKSQDKTIAGYGAPAKANTLLNYFNIGTETMAYIVDDSKWKQGMFTPGKRIPIVSQKTMYDKPVDYLLILAWNFSDSIIKMHKKYLDNGGKFIVPFPHPIII